MKNFFLKLKKQNGFAMLFTVLIVTLILSIALGISNLSFKQTILSSLAKDSQISFYEADTAVECGLYYDTITLSFPLDIDPGSAPKSIDCGNDTFLIDDTTSGMNYLIYKQDGAGSGTCSSILFDKTTGENIIQGRGYNICTDHPRQVERALEVIY